MIKAKICMESVKEKFSQIYKVKKQPNASRTHIPSTPPLIYIIYVYR